MFHFRKKIYFVLLLIGGFFLRIAFAAVPDAPLLVTTESKDKAIKVSWIAPLNTGGKTIVKYIASVPTGEYCEIRSPFSTGLTCTIYNLKNSIMYTISVVAINADGTGPVQTGFGMAENNGGEGGGGGGGGGGGSAKNTTIKLTNQFLPEEDGILPTIRLVGDGCPIYPLSPGENTFKSATCIVVIDRSKVTPPTAKYLSGKNLFYINGTEIFSEVRLNFAGGSTYNLNIFTGLQDETSSLIRVSSDFSPQHKKGIPPSIKLSGTNCPNTSVTKGEFTITQGSICKVEIDHSLMSPPSGGYVIDGNPILKIDGAVVTAPASLKIKNGHKIEVITKITHPQTPTGETINFKFSLSGYAPGVLAMANTGWLVSLNCGGKHITSFHMSNDPQYNSRSLLNVPKGSSCYIEAENILADSSNYYYKHDYNRTFIAGEMGLDGEVIYGDPIHINIYATELYSVPVFNSLGLFAMTVLLLGIYYRHRSTSVKQTLF